MLKTHQQHHISYRGVVHLEHIICLKKYRLDFYLGLLNFFQSRFRTSILGDIFYWKSANSMSYSLGKSKDREGTMLKNSVKKFGRNLWTTPVVLSTSFCLHSVIIFSLSFALVWNFISGVCPRLIDHRSKWKVCIIVTALLLYFSATSIWYVYKLWSSIWTNWGWLIQLINWLFCRHPSSLRIAFRVLRTILFSTVKWPQFQI